MRGLMLIILTIPMLAGCLSDAGEELETEAAKRATAAPGYAPPEGVLSEDIYGILPPVVEYVEATLDGILLHARVHLPDGDGPWPTIFQLSPYNNHQASVMPLGGNAGQSLIDRYVPKGYAVVVADVRGTGNSEGCMGMMDQAEREDAHDLVAWIAAQPWSDGKVGMQGVSYVGTTPHEALVMAPENLVTVVTIAGVTNQWRNTFQNGVPYMGRFYPITYQATEGLPPPTDVERGPAWGINTADGGCGQEGMLGAMRPDVYAAGVYDEYWADRNQTRFVDQANQGNASILYSQGFVDRAVNPSEAVHWFNDLTVPKKGLFHQGGHQYAPREDYFDMELAWFDHWLKGIDTGIMDTPQVEVQLNTGEIRTGETWPPAKDELNMRTLYLAPGELVDAAPDEGSQTYVAGHAIDAADVGRVLGGAVTAATGQATELAYVSAPLETDLLMSGSAWMHLTGSVDADNTYWLFGLYDQAPDGGRTWIAEGWMNAHLHDGFDKSTPLVPGEATRFDFRFEPREYVFAEGHQIVLVVDEAQPAIIPFDQPMTTNTIHLGPSTLQLPVLGDAMVWDAPETV